MVDSVSSTTVRTIDPKVAPVARVTNAAAAGAVSTPATDQQQAAEAPATLAKAMAASAPVDASRVQLIKNAVANGTFPLSPATIADRLIALRYEWMSHDKA